MTCYNNPVIPVLSVSTVQLLMFEDQSICNKPDIQTIPRRCTCCGSFYLMMKLSLLMVGSNISIDVVFIIVGYEFFVLLVKNHNRTQDQGCAHSKTGLSHSVIMLQFILIC